MSSILTTAILLSFVVAALAQWVEPEWEDFDCVIKRDELLQTVAPHIPVYLNGDAVCKPHQPRDTKFPDRIRLTGDVPNQAGSAYTTSTFRNTEYFPFETFFEYEIIPGQDEAVADGIAFVIHYDPVGVDALSSVGGGLGVYNGDPESGPGGIRNALIIEIDTYFNEGPFPPFSNDGYARTIDVIVTDDEDMQRECTKRTYPSPYPGPTGERCGCHILLVLPIFLTFTSEASIQTQGLPTL